MEEIRKQIMTARPNLRPVTIRNYMNQLNKLSHEIDGGALDHLGFLIDIPNVLSYIETLGINSQNTFLSVIIVALTSESPRTPEIDELVKEYREIFMEKKKIYMQTLGTRTKTPKEKEQWKTLKELDKIREFWKAQVLANHIPDKAGLTMKNQMILQKYLITALYTLNAPRRNIYATVKLITTTEFKKLRVEEAQQNFLVFSKNFKTLYFYYGYQKSKAIDKPRVDISSKLKKVIRLYLKFHSNREFLLYTNRGGVMSQNSLSRSIINLFGMGSSMLRKVYISNKTNRFHKYIDGLAQDMGHSATTAKNFYLKD